MGEIEFLILDAPCYTPKHLSYRIKNHGGGAKRPIAYASAYFRLSDMWEIRICWNPHPDQTER
jgi:hypothetical protein